MFFDFVFYKYFKVIYKYEVEDRGWEWRYKISIFSVFMILMPKDKIRLHKSG